jgi:type I restriction enzyme, R subunit
VQWHTQGSGKSLTMIFAGNKLRRHPALESPTVLIVVDRRDLKTQLSDDFEACDYPNVEKALGVRDLKGRLSTNWRARSCERIPRIRIVSMLRTARAG